MQLAESGRAREDQCTRERSQKAALLKEKELLQRRLAVEEEKRQRVAAHAAAQRPTLAKEKEKREVLEQQLVQTLGTTNNQRDLGDNGELAHNRKGLCSALLLR